MLLLRRPSSLLALLYLLLSAGGEALLHAGKGAAGARAEAHLHDAGGGGDDCPPPPHDEHHCPACRLTGLRFLPSGSGPPELGGAGLVVRIPFAGGEPAPALRSHAPTRSRAPPLG